jgi:hypothetical protein
MSTWKEREESYRRDPTRVFLAATIIQSHGHLNHDSMKRIRGAMLAAFTEAAEKEGIASTWALDLKSKTSSDFDAMLARRQMRLDEPESVGAVDPQGGEAAE